MMYKGYEITENSNDLVNRAFSARVYRDGSLLFITQQCKTRIEALRLAKNWIDERIKRIKW